MYDYGEFYEPSEFDEKAEELKDYLRQSVRQEILDEMERCQTADYLR